MMDLVSKGVVEFHDLARGEIMRSDAKEPKLRLSVASKSLDNLLDPFPIVGF